MSWHLAPAARALLNQVNAYAPKRSKISDGTLGDAAHAARDSDHNPDGDDRSVNALDLTHDPLGGLDVDRLIRELIASGDRRLRYAIRNWRIWQRGVGWSTYGGSNGHVQHGHLSFDHDPKLEDDASPYNLPMFGNAPVVPPPYIPPSQEDTMQLFQLDLAVVEYWLVYADGFARNLNKANGEADAWRRILPARRVTAEDSSHFKNGVNELTYAQFKSRQP